MKNSKNINKLAKMAFEKTINTKRKISKGNPIFLDDFSAFCHPDDCETVDNYFSFRKKIKDRLNV